MAKTRIGGTKMWWLPPNYLLFRYPVWPPKTGFLGFLGKPLFWGDRQPGGFREPESGTAPNPVQIRCTKMGVFLTPRKYGFFGFPENPEFCEIPRWLGPQKFPKQTEVEILIESPIKMCRSGSGEL